MIEGDFDKFLEEASPRLRKAFIAARGVDGAADATAEALLYAWKERRKVAGLENPVGYLYRVGLSATRWRPLPPLLPTPPASELPDFEPRLVEALRHLPERQRVALWLVYGCEWSYSEVAEALDIGTSTVGTHLTRGLGALRRALGVTEDWKSNETRG